MKATLSFFTIFFLLGHFNSYSQKTTGVIKGKILAADGKPAISVTVELKQLKRIAITNDNGFFILQHLPYLEDSLIISSVESELSGSAIKLKNGEVKDLGIIRLALNIKQLQQVEIKGRIADSYKSDYSFLGTKMQTALKDIPQSISSVTKELIKDKMEFTLNDAVTDIAGVNHYSGYDEYSIRGFRAENARNINGLRGYNTTYTSSMLVNIERVEVIKGPAATLYGNGDPGGTINLVTKKPLEKNEAEINIATGSWDHFRTLGDITGPLNKNKTLLYRFNAGYDQQHSFRNQYYEKSYQLAPSVSFIPNEKFQFNVDFSLSHINTVLDRGQPGLENADNNLKSTPIYLMASQQGDHLKQTSLASVASFSYKINKHITFNSGYLNYITQQDVGDHGVKKYITNDSVDLYYTQWNYHTVTNTLTNYFTFQFNTGKLSHQLLAGFDYVESEVDLDQWHGELPDEFGDGSGIVGTFSLIHPQYPYRPVNTYHHTDAAVDASGVNADMYHTSGIYLQEQVAFNGWKLLAGLRKEYYRGENEDSAGGFQQNILLPRIGLVYALNTNVSLYATFNKGFDPFEASSSFQIFNEPFKPVMSQLLEAGAKAGLFRSKLFASIAFYQLTLQNVAVNANDPSNPDLYVQRGEDRARGIETEANGNILPNLSVNISYAYNETKIIKSEVHDEIGKIRENAPKHSSSSWIKYTFNKKILKGLSVAIGHSQVSMRNTLDENLTLPGYIILNAGIQYAYKHFILALNMNNLTNKTYWASAYNNINKWPGEPRNFMINLGYKL
ncbi:MAG: TonB-dependent siderophore receptor [Bacteroidetes bacterium]|nr:TonB-dependent siderophore receptor [Bacteroidota bacterium]